MSGRVDLVEGRCPGALRPMQSGDGLILRVRPRLGRLSLAQLEALAAAARFGDGNLSLSNRANVHIRGLTGAGHAAALDVLAAAHLIDGDPRVEAIRNIMVAPAIALCRPAVTPATRRVSLSEKALRSAKPASVDSDRRPPHPVLLPKGRRDLSTPATLVESAVASSSSLTREGAVASSPSPLGERGGVRGDFRPASMHAGIGSRNAEALALAAGLEDVLAKTEALHELPGKFGIAVQAGDDVDPGATSDVTFLVQPDRISMLLDGAFDRAVLFGNTQHAAGGFISVALTFLRLQRRHPSARRMRDAIRHLGFDAVSGAAGLSPVTSAPPSLDGLAPVGDLGEIFGIAFAFGEIMQAALGQIIGFMEREGVAEAAPSSHRALVFPTRGQDAHAFHDLARRIGGITDPGDIRLRIHSCQGAPACWRGTVPARLDAQAVLDALGPMEFPAGTIHISGCGKRCAYPRDAVITAVGADGRYTVLGPRSESRNTVDSAGLAATIADLARTS